MSGDADTRLQDLAAEAATKILALNDQRLREAIEAGRDWYLLVRPDLKESVSTIIRDDTGAIVCITADTALAPPRTEPLNAEEQARVLAQIRAGYFPLDDRTSGDVAALTNDAGSWQRLFNSFRLIESGALPRGRCTLVKVDWPATPTDDLPSRS